MDAIEVRSRLDAALDKLKKIDAYLFETDAAERAIAARLAIYLQSGFSDAECDRAASGPKKVDLPNDCDGHRDSDGKLLSLPDVIVHHRGPAGPNLLVVEMKKTTNRDKGDCDRLRLRAFRDQLGYQFGALIICETRKGRAPKAAVADWVEI